MVRRPHLDVQWSRPTLGATMKVRVTLSTSTRTRVGGVGFSLQCVERIARRRRRSVAIARVHFKETLTLPAMLLQPGESRSLEVEFALPSDAPQTYWGRNAVISWKLAVQARLPWWLGFSKQQRRNIDVAPAPRVAAVRPPLIVVSHEGGPRPGELYAEATLDNPEVAPGDVVSGRFSIEYSAGMRLRNGCVALSARERVSTRSSEVETLRFVARLWGDGAAPSSGCQTPFSIRLPCDAASTFQTDLTSLRWTIELIVVRSLRRNIVLPIPLTVGPRSSLPVTSTELPFQPSASPPQSVGPGRRVAVFAEAARRAGLSHDDGERMQTSLANIQIDVRSDEKGQLLTSLRWPALGLGLQVTPQLGPVGFFRRKWAWRYQPGRRGRSVVDVQRVFGALYRVKVRDQEQVGNLLHEEAQTALIRVHCGEISDTGACIRLKRVPQDAVAFAEFLRERVMPLANALDAGIEMIPTPAQVVRFASGWRAWAARHDGRFEPGRLFVHGAQVGGWRVDLGLEWSGAGMVQGTRVRLALAFRLPDAVDLATIATRLDPATHTRLSELAVSASELHAEPSYLEVLVAVTMLDPHASQPIVETLARLAERLRGPLDAAPYR